MTPNETQIKVDIKAHIDKEGSSYRTWYVGVTNNIERRLFEEHGVNKDKGWWIYRTASTATIARRIEQHFLNLGTDGGPGGGDDTARIVYAYKKTSYTNP